MNRVLSIGLSAKRLHFYNSAINSILSFTKHLSKKRQPITMQAKIESRKESCDAIMDKVYDIMIPAFLHTQFKKRLSATTKINLNEDHSCK